MWIQRSPVQTREAVPFFLRTSTLFLFQCDLAHQFLCGAAVDQDAVVVGDESGTCHTLADALRDADAKHRLAFVLSRAAGVDLARGEAGVARVRAGEALEAASTLGRESEVVAALCMLARSALATGDRETAESLRAQAAARQTADISHEAWEALADLGDALAAPIATG